jgi:hypothetical protein
VFSDAALVNINPESTKFLGLYTKDDAPLLNQLITDLQRVFNEKDGLLDNQRIYLRLRGDQRQQQLTTDIRFPSEVPEYERSKSLFLHDYATLVAGVAKTVYQLWAPANLSDYGPAADELKKLAEWGESGGTDQASLFRCFATGMKSTRCSTARPLLSNRCGSRRREPPHQPQKHRRKKPPNPPMNRNRSRHPFHLEAELSKMKMLMANPNPKQTR